MGLVMSLYHKIKTKKKHLKKTIPTNLANSLNKTGADGTIAKYDWKAIVVSLSVFTCSNPRKYLSGALESYCSISIPTTKYSPREEDTMINVINLFRT